MKSGTYRMTWPIHEPRTPLADLIGQAQHELGTALHLEGLVCAGSVDWRITNQRGPRLTALVPVTDVSAPPAPVARELAPHGTHAAFIRHRSHGTAPCDACVAGEREYQRSRHVRRRQARLQVAG